MDDFENKLWKRLKHPQTNDDLTARDVMFKVQRVFPRKQNLVISLLRSIDDPLRVKRLKRLPEEVNAPLLHSFTGRVPTRKELRNLRRRLQTIGRDLDTFAANGMSFRTDFFVKLAEDCRSAGKYLKYVDMARAMEPMPKVRTLTYKAFWKHVPMAALCWELRAPKVFSFSEIERLLRCAYSARNLTWNRPARSIEREYTGFKKLRSSDPLKSAQWSRILERFLSSLTAMK